MSAKINKFYDFPPASGKEPEKLVLLLHGLGSNGQDLISLAPLWAPSVPDAVWISPDAPFRCDMVPEGYPNAYQWFSLQDRNPETMRAGIETALPVLTSFMDEMLEKYGLGADQMALVGFSQGTMMSLYTAPRYKNKSSVAGVLGYSGALFGEEELSGAPKFPVRLIHGEADGVVPVDAYHHARQALEKAGYSVSGHTSPYLQHSIDDRGVESGGAFLAEILG